MLFITEHSISQNMTLKGIDFQTHYSLETFFVKNEGSLKQFQGNSFVRLC